MLVFLMILCHIFDDFFLQAACLSQLKQKSWWDAELTKMYRLRGPVMPDKENYQYDYLCALFIHALCWSISISLPLMLFGWNTQLGVLIIVNTLIHAWIDDLKANQLKINLVTDQGLHLLQIVLTYLFWVAA